MSSLVEFLNIFFTNSYKLVILKKNYFNSVSGKGDIFKNISGLYHRYIQINKREKAARSGK